MSVFVPSPYQSGFFHWIDKGQGSCVLVAVAGSGKTTSVIEGLAFVPHGQSVILLAFNTAIAKELTERVAARFAELSKAGKHAEAARYSTQYVTAKTFHALGFGVIRKYLEKKGVRMGNPDGNKVRALAREYLGADSAEYEMYADYSVKLVGLAKGQGIGCLVPDVDSAWYDLAGHHDLYLDDEKATEERAVTIARELLRRSNDVALKGILDFDDMLYLVCKWSLRLWQNDWIFVDEAQDTNPVRRALAKLALRPGGRLVAVGDPCQAIYGFTGASHDAIDLIKHEFNAAELPLTVCYRCATDIVAEAKTIVSHIEAFSGAQKGKVETLKLNEALSHLGAHDAILCRQTAPLIKLAYTLIGQGTACRVMGRDIGVGLVSLVKRAKAKGLEQLETKLEAYREREMAKFTAKGQEQKADAINDRVSSIFTVIESLDENHRTIPALIEAINGLFSDTNGCLTLGTVHKSKGKEWPTVAILEPELMPSKFARQDWQYQQEKNLMYVAYTRAMSHLIFLQTEKKEAGK